MSQNQSPSSRPQDGQQGFGAPPPHSADSSGYPSGGYPSGNYPSGTGSYQSAPTSYPSAPGGYPSAPGYPPPTEPRVGVQHPPEAFAPAPAGPPGPTPTPIAPTPAGGTSRRTFLTAVIASTALALVAGGAAGYGAAELAGQGATPTPTSTASTTQVAPQTESDTADVADKVLMSTVTIAYRSNTTGGTGSGFVLDSQGHIVTNNHVIEGAVNGGTQLMVEFTDGRRVPASLVGRSPSYDLAVIRVSANDPLTPVELGDSDSVRPGQGVLAVGAPLGLGGSVTAGIVSAVERPFGVGDANDESGATTFINGIQTDAAINPGNSGGPLADTAGRVIGVNSAILTLGAGSEGGRSGNIGLGFAIPINQARTIAEEIIRDGQATYPVIGAAVGPNAEGVRLTSVTAGGPAARAGLATGDIVTAADGKPVDTPTDLIVRIRTHRPGEQVELTVRGRGPVSVTLGSKVG